MFLLTAFEPFDKWDTNPSWEIARALDRQTLAGIQVTARRLPVDWETSWPALHRAIEETHPRWVLMLGQAGSRPQISVETRGLNICAPRPDNRGRLPSDPLIETGGPNDLAATLPVDAIIAAIRGLGLPVELSEDAAGYLCNHTLYKALTWAKPIADAPQIGFIHVPSLPDAAATGIPPGIALEDMIAAVRSAITCIVSQTKESQ